MKKLKSVNKIKNPGLSKLPKEVRNKMGYMQKGGKALSEKDKKKFAKLNILTKNPVTKNALKEGMQESGQKFVNDMLLRKPKPSKKIGLKSNIEKGYTKKPKMAKGGKVKNNMSKPAMMEGGQVQHSSQIGDSVATYQGNGNYKAGE